MTDYFRRSVLVLLIIGILYGLYLLILLTIPYLEFNLNTDFLKTKRSVVHLRYYRIGFYAHIFSSPFLILTGLTQFSTRLMREKPVVHRVLGIIYLSVLLLIAAPGGMILAVHANGFLITKLSFIALTTAWIVTAIFAYKTAISGQFEAHGKWMTRNFALTLSAITLRFYAYLLGEFDVHLPPKEAYTLISFLSWIPNLLVAELLIRRGFVRRMLEKRVRDHVT